MKAGLPLLLLLCLVYAGAGRRAPRPVQDVPRPEESQPVCTLCPVITVWCPSEPQRPGVPIDFKAKVLGAGPDRTLTYRWTASAGTITSGAEGDFTTSGGNAERTAVVDTTGLPINSNVIATVEITGLDRSCANTASCTTAVYAIIDHFPIDEYGNLRFSDEMARLDNFATALQSDPTMNGYVICYGGRRGRRGEARARSGRAKNYLVTRRKIAPERLVTVDGGYREDLTVVLWMLPQGVEFTPSPTVDPSEVEFTDPPAKSKRQVARQRRSGG